MDQRFIHRYSSNASALDTILPLEAICYATKGLLSRWSESGSPEDSTGNVTFYSDKGAEVISLTLHKCNGLYSSSVNAVGDASSSASIVDQDVAVYFHTGDDSDDDVSLDFDDGIEYPEPLLEANRNERCPLKGPTPSGPTMPPMSIPTPKSSTRPQVLKSKQAEADLWQACLGHCSNWQLKVIPMSKFTPHLFASYDVYNQARIQKQLATCGKHPSCAATAVQRWYMDFGFLRASQFDYSRDKGSRGYLDYFML
jgi:hypothetical protein